uniref:5-formyltetrahydrofolate cyclo-ligase n=1 Tax=Meloidogyne javanica TaxID=6303 RepID=A0A915LUV5_MELJA
MLATKKLIRKQIKQKIDQLLSESEGLEIIEKETKRIAIYVSTFGEIITDEIILRALEDGKELKLSSKDEFAKLERTTWGIRQHSSDLSPPTYFDGMTTTQNEQFLDLIVMPGVAFTLNGKRLGHGRGYYDRFLLEYSQKCNGTYPKTIALALNLQIIEDLPMSERDLNINVFISIIDVNDNSPKFSKNGKFNINLHEELPIGTKINLDFKAVDNDQPGPNSHIRYKIIENSTLLIIEPKPIKAWDGDSINETILYKLSGENSKYFIIDEFNGIIQTKTNKLPSSAQLIINI